MINKVNVWRLCRANRRGSNRSSFSLKNQAALILEGRQHCQRCFDLVSDLSCEEQRMLESGLADYVSGFLCLLLLAPGTLPGKVGMKTSLLVMGIS